MFDVEKDDLLRLSDGDLRGLVARLCQAELSLLGAPVSAVISGGAQDAPDGGLDVDVQVEDHGFSGDFVPCARTGFQVKKSKMPAGKILNEMSPNGALRPIFSELDADMGCYIIVSLGDDPTGPQLAARKRAMRSQIKARKLDELQTKFYGRSDLASWLGKHVGVQLWAREKLNLPLTGWRPFGRWTASPRNAEDSLICEPGVVIRLPGREQEELGIAEGIEGIRELLRNSEKAVRIIGLSGVGKSRIVQALFEGSVGSKPLDKHLAIYADLGDETTPSAREVVERLAAVGRPAIVVLDNCPAERHNQIAGEVARWSNLSLVTVEYDIREDRSEGTSVVRIEARGPDIAAKLVERRYPEVDRLDARRIGELSGGNARVALALANAAGETESLSSFSDSQLFERLFYQREGRDTTLLKAAEVLALVYSFSVSDDEEGVDELDTLAGFLDESRLALYGQAQTLVDRQLAQKRERWRAVLPHAVANWLAARALRNIPVTDIVNTFQGLRNGRLLKSFGKRLGYLHDDDNAKDIVKCWFATDGRLHGIDQFDKDDIQLFEEVAPVYPEGVLGLIEHQDSTFFSARRNPYYYVFVDLLAKIGYDPDYFEKCVILLAKFVLTEKEGLYWDSIRNRLFGLFQLNLSGTRAGSEVREGLVRRYLSSGRRNEQGLGLGMLKAALRSEYWAPGGDIEFGARPRDDGYRPRTWKEVDDWFKRFILVAREAAMVGNDHVSAEIRILIGVELRGLWRIEGLRETLANSGRVLGENGGWREGLRAVRLIKRYDCRKAGDGTVDDGGDLLDEMEEALKPKNLSDEVRTYVLSAQDQVWDLDEELDLSDSEKWDKARDRAGARAYRLGTLVAAEPEVLDELSQEFFTAYGRPTTIDFGRGMASTCRDPRALWDRLVGCLEVAGDEARDCGVLEGVLKFVHERDEPLAQRILDEVVENCVLRKFMVEIQTSVPLDCTGLNRLHRSLDLGDMPMRQFEYLNWYFLADKVGETGVGKLMLKILDKPGGAEIVLRGLSGWLRKLKRNEFEPSRVLKSVGLTASAKLLRGDSINHNGGVTDVHLSEVLGTCLDGNVLPEETEDVWDAYFGRIRTSHLDMWQMETTSAVLAQKGTFRFLDGMFQDSGLADTQRFWAFREGIRSKSPLSGVRAQLIMDWCRRDDFQDRLRMVSEAIYPFEERQDDELVLSEQALAIIKETEDPSAVLSHLSLSACSPRGHSGSVSDAIAKRCEAFRTLFRHERLEVREAAAAQIDEIEKREEQERQYERAIDRRFEQRFE